MFGNKTIPGNPQADWGRDATREQVITAVPLRNWVVLYTKRDQQRAQDYIGHMLKVCPQMGIDAQAPTRFELRDDRTETFVRALRENINPRVSICSSQDIFCCFVNIQTQILGHINSFK